MSRQTTDIIVIGSGVAGCTAALHAAKSGKDVLLITKNADPLESNTRYAQGGIVAIGKNDSAELLYRDIMKAGDGICNPDAARLVAEEGPRLVYDFLIDEVGVAFTRGTGGELHFTREAAHSRTRVLHHLDMTGLEIEQKLVARIQRQGNIRFLKNSTAIDLITSHHHSKNSLLKYSGNLCLGAYVLDNETGEVHTLLAHATIVATGGIGKLYRYTTNPPCATGDGISMAYRAGAAVTNMEYVQFHPTMFYTEGENGFLISEAVRGEGGRLLNSRGEEFMHRYSPEWKDLAPRDEVARAIYNEMAATENSHVYLDIAHFNAKHIAIRERFPGIWEECLKHKIDMEREAIPVVPAEHYFCGGILVNEHGECSLPGLYAAGESSCTGVHGANRLASVSLLEGLVYGKRAGLKAENAGKKDRYFPDIADWVYPKTVADVDDPLLVLQDWNNLRSTMWNYVGIIRTQTRLNRAESDVRNLSSRVADYYRNSNLTRAKIELRNGILVADLIAHSARRNRTSIGCHHIVE
jgi:L-aspartate oxidase